MSLSGLLQTYQKILREFISFPSISTDSNFVSALRQTADFLQRLFQQHGFDCQRIEGYGNPMIVARYIVDPSFKTCLIYGHYDVQPANQDDGWASDPFAVVEKDGRLIARGIIDNKGQVLVHMATIFDLISAESLGYNVVLFLEGNEETGSPAMEQFVRDHRQLLQADFALISDGEISGGHPIIEAGFRGGFNSTLTVKTGHTDLHSGIYGGASPNAAFELSKFLAQLFDDNNRVTIVNFYDQVDEISVELRKQNKMIPFQFDEHQKTTGNKALVNEPEHDFYTQVGLRPTIQITSLSSGYMGEGYRNGIPYQASVKINFRLVKNQQPDIIVQQFQEHVRLFFPQHVEIDLVINDPYEGIKLNLDNDYVVKAKNVLEQVFGKQVFFKYSGGGLPIVTYFDQILSIPQVLVPLANEDCNMHAVNENFELEQLEKSLEFSRIFFSSQS